MSTGRYFGTAEPQSEPSGKREPSYIPALAGNYDYEKKEKGKKDPRPPPAPSDQNPQLSHLSHAPP